MPKRLPRWSKLRCCTYGCSALLLFVSGPRDRFGLDPYLDAVSVAMQSWSVQAVRPGEVKVLARGEADVQVQEGAPHSPAQPGSLRRPSVAASGGAPANQGVSSWLLLPPSIKKTPVLHGSVGRVVLAISCARDIRSGPGVLTGSIASANDSL